MDIILLGFNMLQFQCIISDRTMWYFKFHFICPPWAISVHQLSICTNAVHELQSASEVRSLRILEVSSSSAIVPLACWLLTYFVALHMSSIATITTIVIFKNWKPIERSPIGSILNLFRRQKWNLWFVIVNRKADEK